MTFPDDLDGVIKLFSKKRGVVRKLEGRPAYVANPLGLARTVELQRELVQRGELKPAARAPFFYSEGGTT